MDRTYSTLEVARTLGVSVQSVQRWVDIGRLRAWVTPGGHRRIDASDAEALFKEHAEQRAAPPATPVLRPLSVLVVDDNPHDRELALICVQEVLPGALITPAANGFEALVAVGRQPFDVLVTDVVMPNMNGFEMLRHVALDGPHKPACVVATSNHSLAELRAMGTLPPGVTFMPKPLDAAALSAFVASKLPQER